MYVTLATSDPCLLPIPVPSSPRHPPQLGKRCMIALALKLDTTIEIDIRMKSTMVGARPLCAPLLAF